MILVANFTSLRSGNLYHVDLALQTEIKSKQDTYYDINIHLYCYIYTGTLSFQISAIQNR